MTRVLLVEDSRVVQTYVTAVLRQAPGLELVGVVADGLEAVSEAQRLRPDVILMDIELPGQSGIAATAQIMASAPCHIIVLSARLSGRSAHRPFHALEAGAVEVLHKPRGADLARIDDFMARLVSAVSKREPGTETGRRSGTLPARAAEGVAIGTSTGGPAALHTLLGHATAPIPVPVVVAQHIEPGFERGLAQWLRGTEHDVRVAQPGDTAEPGVVWLVPADKHLVLTPGARFEEAPDGPASPRPSADLLLASAARCWGRDALGVVMTGMGRDGARGLKAMHDAGALTVVQDQESAIVWSMPGAAMNAGAADRSLSLPALATLIDDVSAHRR